MKKNHDIIEVCCRKKYETDKAVLVYDLKDKEVWIPKSQIEIDADEKGSITFQIPEWLAMEKGLI